MYFQGSQTFCSSPFTTEILYGFYQGIKTPLTMTILNSFKAFFSKN
jgi:hypothetical protein